MKRYRVLAFSFDTRARLLATEIQDSWESQVKSQWMENKRKIREGLVHEFGAQNHEEKIENFIELGASPLSLLAFHNAFLGQCRKSFVVGSYYSALVSACTLGERILNRLIIHLREYFRSTTEYKKIYRKESFDNWEYAIGTLESWEVLLPAAAEDLRQLGGIRHQAVHFNPETDQNARELAIEAIHLLQNIVEKQFSAFGSQPWYIEGARGAAYVAKQYEDFPFVKEVVIPNCVLVGPHHKLEHGSNGWIVHDEDNYEDKEITDDEFLSLLR
ncbi:hypothetical protein Q7C_1474 [Methylophaga frappieri]|uniref:Uncharacterized protein n=1 Tax=Methylophaga frappieri (strain ATCC BAA-2434 / DSM 25690 / JAM7) TaxID=754477 RepID=I1YI80_METFJ|nr:hypothetical protein [Methylophaga frappieri]AFJ02623.1 hypothetical protein Q7C_1474 [Methylophaga frappieri]